MTCYIIDDEIYSIQRLKDYIKKIPELELIGSYTNPLLALTDIQNRGKPDIIFLDIDMPELSGLEVDTLLPKDIAIIFVTGHMEEAYNAFERDAIDFILKPYDFERFVRAINKVKIKPKAINNKADRIFIKSGSRNKIIQIDITEIVQIEAYDHYIYIHMRDIKHMVYISIKEIEEQLPSNFFIQTHRAHIVNIDLIKSIEGNQILMKNDTIIPLTRLFKDSFLKKIQTRMIKK